MFGSLLVATSKILKIRQITGEYTFSNMPSSIFNGGISINIRKKPKGKSIWWSIRICETINDNGSDMRIECFAYTIVQLIIYYCTPILWFCVGNWLKNLFLDFKNNQTMSNVKHPDKDSFWNQTKEWSDVLLVYTTDFWSNSVFQSLFQPVDRISFLFQFLIE